MASGSGISKDSVRISENEYPVIDIVSCVRFEDIYGFFSMREALDNKKKKFLDLGDNVSITSSIRLDKSGSFQFPEGGRISKETKKKFDSMKDYVSVETDFTDKLTGVKFSLKGNRKKDESGDFGDIFATKRVIQSINRRGGKLEEDSRFYELDARKFFTELDKALRNFIGNSERDGDGFFRKINRELLSDGNFQLLRVIAKRVESRSNVDPMGPTLTRAKEGMIHPTDFKKLQERFVNPGGKGSFPIYLMKFSLPRFSSAEMLVRIMESGGGSKTIYSGRRCWNITNKSLEGKKVLALYPNIEVDESSMTVSNVNLSLFLKKEMCNGEKYELDDKILGYFKDGYFDFVSRDILEESKSDEIRFFQNNFRNNKSEVITSSLLNSIKQKFKYPRKTESLLLMREDTFTPSFSSTENNAKEYVNGFYNSFGRKSDISIDLKRELVRFILFRYVGRDEKFLLDEASKRREAKQILLRVQKDVERGKDQASFLGGDKVTKRDIVRLIELFTYRKEEADLGKNDGIVTDAYRYGSGKALRNFLADPNVRFGTTKGEEFPLLRSISYFVMCEYNNICESIIDIQSSPGNSYLQSISYLKVRGGSRDYSLYYDKVNKYFTRRFR